MGKFKLGLLAGISALVPGILFAQSTTGMQIPTQQVYSFPGDSTFGPILNNSLLIYHPAKPNTGLAEVDGMCVVGVGGVWTAAACPSSGGGSGTVTTMSVVSTNGFAGTVANASTTPAITLSTTLTGLIKGNGTAFSAAAAGTDYLAPSGSGASLTGLTFAQLGSLPTTLAGHGITNGATNGANSNITSLTGLTTPLSAAQGGTGLGSLGTGIAAALGINIGSAGAPVLFNGAGGTPSSLVLTNATGLPAAQVPVTPTTSGTNVTLTGPRAIYRCTAACTITLPAPVTGYEFCIRRANNTTGVITLAALGSSAMYELTTRTGYGTAGAGTAVSSGLNTDQICLQAPDATHYDVMAATGTWVMN